MEITITAPESGLVHSINVTMNKTGINEKIEAKLREVAKTIKMDGFRKGKVPPSMVKRLHGARIENEVVFDAVVEAFYNAMDEKAIKLAGQPSFTKIDPTDDQIHFSADFEVFPDITINDLQDLQLTKISAEIQDDDVDHMINRLREQSKAWKTVDDVAAENGHQVMISFVGKQNGEPFERGSGENTPLELGSGRMIPGFEDGIVGMKADESKTIDVTFPEDYHADNLKGQTVQFDITVHSVQEKQLPELDETFAKKFGIESGQIDDLYADIRQHMERELSQTITSKNKSAVFDAVVAANPIDVPNSLVEQEALRMVEEAKQNYKQQGMDNTDFLNADMFKEQAQKRVQIGLVLDALISTHNIEADDAEVEAYITQQAEAYENPTEVFEHYQKNPKQMHQLKALVVENKAVDYCYEQGKTEIQTETFQSLLPAQ